MDRIIWWTGASILSAVGFLGTVLAFAAIVGAAVMLANYYGRRAWNLQDNLRCMAQWHKAGRPKWHHEDGKPAVMRPTTWKPGQ